jgi:hypothetical protein
MLMSLLKSTDTKAYDCCDYHYLLNAYRREDAIRSAERARLARATRRPSTVYLRGAALLGGGMIWFGTTLIRLGGRRTPEAEPRLLRSVPLNLRLLQ